MGRIVCAWIPRRWGCGVRRAEAIDADAMRVVQTQILLLAAGTDDRTDRRARPAAPAASPSVLWRTRPELAPVPRRHRSSARVRSAGIQSSDGNGSGGSTRESLTIPTPSPRRITSATSGCPGKAVLQRAAGPTVTRFPQTTPIAQRKHLFRHPLEGGFRAHTLSPRLRRGFLCDLTGSRGKGILQ
jgi:hypothetical protein